MKKPCIQDIVFQRHFPKPKQNEPQNFYSHVQRNLVPEVRVEVQNFYGALDNLEAQYPGLDYTYEPHRRRLARFPWHKRLFRHFDELRLTDTEILSICQWEGTKSAKDKYEAETGRKIRDTTTDEIMALPKSTPSAAVYQDTRRRMSTDTVAHIGTIDGADFTHCESGDEDEIDARVDAQLHGQLMAVAEGEMTGDGPLDEWLKYMTERDAERDSMIQAVRAGHPQTTVLEHIRAHASVAVSSGDVVASNASNSLPRLRSMTASSQQGYGTSTEEILAAR